MSSGDRCKECGALLPAESPGGLCGHCLFGLGLAQGLAGSESGDSAAAPEGAVPRPSAVEGPDADPRELLPRQRAPAGGLRSGTEATLKRTANP